MQPDTASSKPRIVVTGALGFIGSCVAAALHRTGRFTLILSDDFSRTEKLHNLDAVPDAMRIERDALLPWLEGQEAGAIHWILHIGARTDTTEFDEHVFDVLNVQYTKDIWRICTQKQIPLIYASSAATYGGGEHGYSDAHAGIGQLQPLNPYGWSKQVVDTWILAQPETPPHWYGLKFFNVYGPNEYHKSRMASVVMHAFHQMQKTGKVKLFRSHRPEFKDGFQLRDFIYVLDVVQVIMWLMEHTPGSGIYNLGTGKAESFYQLAASAAQAMGIPLSIDWIDIPEDIRNTYQYFTEADMRKLKEAGYTSPFTTLSSGVDDYVRNYLIEHKYF